MFDSFISLFIGVPIFFMMSGFLIWSSIESSQGCKEYLKKRFWRIYPELWTAVIVELLVLLLLYRQPVDWTQVGVFALTQGSSLQFWTPDCLRGYGCGCPNGALWTICVLVQFYLLAVLLHKCLHGRKLWIWGLSIGASICLGVLTGKIKGLLPGVAAKLYVQTDISYGIYIYHMTIINALITLGLSDNLWLFFIVLAVSCLFAWASTMTVGKWAAGHKGRIQFVQ